MPSTKPQTVADILKKFNPLEDKYISREFQAYGIYLSEELGDYKHRALYIRLAKTIPRAILEKALNFVKASNARSKARLFMWKLKELRTTVK
ncbi:TPA: hypothetical protein DIV55_02835 [Patescibacteria group bacterium]|uniref:Uncharacterized protein n=1 Tax=Candidatus Gottesmanbacteria bacterium GW2011_GWA1_43_11 TaxID=1618436 RepID=A0A0G1CHI2_9BACT|nr:MAG: hypothetical protein UV59_C0012G0032 [Candidatus Gottesmanbacteria bacterium GW2011_GWA1_43_11]HCS78656.1 hypothetical protein [Patescibacteria group bacterium]